MSDKSDSLAVNYISTKTQSQMVNRRRIVRQSVKVISQSTSCNDLITRSNYIACKIASNM